MLAHPENLIAPLCSLSSLRDVVSSDFILLFCLVSGFMIVFFVFISFLPSPFKLPIKNACPESNEKIRVS